MQVEAVELVTATGQTVRGQRWGEASAWALLVHDLGQDLDAWADLPALLAESGFAALAFDLPGHGLSDDPWEPRHFVETVEAVLQSAADAGARRRFLIAAGSSVGASLLAARGGRADALIGLSPRADPEIASAMREADLPKLFFVGAADREALAAAEEVARLCVGWTVLSTFPIAEQGTEMLSTSWGAHLREQILLFLRDYRP